jgi:NtrC-family two-component system response regulator AlgB
MTLRTLVVDDEAPIRKTLGACLESAGASVELASDAESALRALRRAPVDVAFVDLRLGDQDGLALVPELLDASRSTAVVVITAFATFETAVEAMRRGASDFLPKPFTPAQVRHVLARLVSRRKLEDRVQTLEDMLDATQPSPLLATRSTEMRNALDVAERAADSDVACLLRGESGTGKGVLARFIHDRSPRRERPFVTVNCPTLTGDLLAAELFGHTRGAFTGAVKDAIGRVEAADGGTLFLDEISEISPAMQAKLLRFVQDHEFERVGDARTRRANVRILAATNRDLEDAVKEGSFRIDLLYRLNVVELDVPPLRRRREDLPALARHFLSFAAKQAGRPEPELSPEAEATLVTYDWPGNVRELRNEMERALVLTRSRTLQPTSFSPRVSARPHEVTAMLGVGGDVTIEALERAHVEAVLARTATQEEAASILGIDPSTLWRKRKRWGL